MEISLVPLFSFDIPPSPVMAALVEKLGKARPITFLRANSEMEAPYLRKNQ